MGGGQRISSNSRGQGCRCFDWDFIGHGRISGSTGNHSSEEVQTYDGKNGVSVCSGEIIKTLLLDAKRDAEGVIYRHLPLAIVHDSPHASNVIHHNFASHVVVRVKSLP